MTLCPLRAIHSRRMRSLKLLARLFARLDQELVARSCGFGCWVVPYVEAEEVEALREVHYPSLFLGEA